MNESPLSPKGPLAARLRRRIQPFWIACNSPQLDYLDLWRFPIRDVASPPAIAPTARVTQPGRSPSCWTV